MSDGLGALPCPSQSKLSQASDISQIGTSVTSKKIRFVEKMNLYKQSHSYFAYRNSSLEVNKTSMKN